MHRPRGVARLRLRLRLRLCQQIRLSAAVLRPHPLFDDSYLAHIHCPPVRATCRGRHGGRTGRSIMDRSNTYSICNFGDISKRGRLPGSSPPGGAHEQVAEDYKEVRKQGTEALPEQQLEASAVEEGKGGEEHLWAMGAQSLAVVVLCEGTAVAVLLPLHVGLGSLGVYLARAGDTCEKRRCDGM